VLAIKSRRSPAVIVARVERWTLRGADLCDWSLSHGDLAGFDLREALLRGCRLRGADLRGANLCGADLSDAELTGALLSEAVYDQETRWPAGFDPGPAGAVPAEAATGWSAGRGDHRAEIRGRRIQSQIARARSREVCERAQQLQAQVERLVGDQFATPRIQERRAA
jgi:hypothetical protein